MESQNVDTNAQQDHDKDPSKRRPNRVCRFYNSKKGCTAGVNCKFQHVSNITSHDLAEASASKDPGIVTSAGPPASSQTPSGMPGSSKVDARPQSRSVVTKPVPVAQRQNPRDFQIGQLMRRFNPVRSETPEGTNLDISLKPSDPDFPFELDALRMTLFVPQTWPTSTGPVIQVKNQEIPVGFAINVERGFASLVSSSKSLLATLNEFDRHLEHFLSSEKAQTIKIVANRARSNKPTEVAPAGSKSEIVLESIQDLRTNQPKPWTSDQVSAAKEKRELEIRQLEARMSRLPLFSVSKDRVSFSIPLQIPKPGRLPLSLQAVKEFTLIVPLLYNLEPCKIRLKGVTGHEADQVELAFESHANDHPEMTLMAHINHLNQHLPDMAIQSTPVIAAEIPKKPELEQTNESKTQQQYHSITELEGTADSEKPHLRFLAHPPPEWAQPRNQDQDPGSETSDDETDDDYDSDESPHGQDGGAAVPAAITTSTLEKGLLISFPQMEMVGIELLELHTLGLSVKCDRCKEVSDIKHIKPASSLNGTLIRTETCKKCTSPLSASYRAEPMHSNSIKAGSLDLDGCTVVDMLPSSFIPTCAECSTTQSAPGISSVRGDTSHSVCRECHRKMTLKIVEVKFLRVASNDARVGRALPPKRKKENLGISAGQELPARGRCKHYSKSYRWFRFSCCNRVYACDRCHDEKEEHANEHANRMICGWCSREQIYRPEDCSLCHRSVIRKTGGGFWEGGKGTRDRVKMNRNDPRKYKRVGGTTVGEKKASTQKK